MPTVLIVDDHPAFRRSVASLLEADGLVVVGEAATGREALDLAGTLQPDVVLLDIGLPDVSGIDVAAVLARGGDMVVVLTSSREADAYGERLTSVPTVAFVPKHELSSSVIARLAGA